MRQLTLFVFCVLYFSCSVFADDRPAFGQFGADIKDDYKNYYSSSSLWKLAGGLAVGGVFANTSMDQDIYEWYVNDVKSVGTDDIADIVEPFGDGLMTIPVYAGACIFELFAENNKTCGVISEWGQRSLRSIVVGAPALLTLQVATGGARPTEDDGSTWRPFNDGNGVSGHSFMGAVPFLSAAGMTENRILKSVFYIGSVLCGLSRINDEDHYFSQSLLGWWLAYLSTSAVNKTDCGDRFVNAAPILFDDYAGIGIRFTF